MRQITVSRWVYWPKRNQHRESLVDAVIGKDDAYDCDCAILYPSAAKAWEDADEGDAVLHVQMTITDGRDEFPEIEEKQQTIERSSLRALLGYEPHFDMDAEFVVRGDRYDLDGEEHAGK